MTHTLEDAEFGTISIRRSRLARNVRLKVDHRGMLIVSMPTRTPLYVARRLVNEAREQIRVSLYKNKRELAVLRDGDIIGKSHRLVIRRGDTLHGRVIGTFVEIIVPSDAVLESSEIQTYIKEVCLRALRTQAKAYLTRQLSNLAHTYDFTYESIRFSAAGTRWGSCSSMGTISLNVWLMQLPHALIDYVLIHELCHTRQMNHSPAFWRSVETIVPDYKQRRRELKAWRPYL